MLWLRTVFQYFVLKDYTVKEVGKTNFNLFPLFCENDKKTYIESNKRSFPSNLELILSYQI